MHRCWLDTHTTPAPGESVALSLQESDHILKVLRMKAEDPVQLIAADCLFSGKIDIVVDDIVQIRIMEELSSPESKCRITLMQGLPKADKLEWIVQKTTELGVYRVLPVEMARSVAQISKKEDKKRDRLARIALEAAKQSGRAHVPEVFPAMRFSDAVKQLHGTVYVAWEEADALRLSDAVAKDQPEEITLVIGPEGGITMDEIEALTAIGAKTVTLGKRILRTETAGICAMAISLTALGEM